MQKKNLASRILSDKYSKESITFRKTLKLSQLIWNCADKYQNTKHD